MEISFWDRCSFSMLCAWEVIDWPPTSISHHIGLQTTLGAIWPSYFVTFNSPFFEEITRVVVVRYAYSVQYLGMRMAHHMPSEKKCLRQNLLRFMFKIFFAQKIYLKKFHFLNYETANESFCNLLGWNF